jgi:glucoamylase
LLVAAAVADMQGEPELAAFLRETADAWNDAIERLLYVRGTELARAAGVDGYYVRFANPEQMQAPAPAYGNVIIPNHPPEQRERPAWSIVSPDALQLVRFGLRAADDPRIVNTVKVIDRTCKIETPHGPCWHRYAFDGYGEHADGSPFNGTGIGRAWPLLTGERGHYELAAGRADEADRLLHTMESFAGDSGLFPEQIWDSADIPERELYCGRPSGSAMPLVWAHAEYVKLRRSLHDGRVFDMPAVTVERYLQQKTRGRHVCWHADQRWRAMPCGKVLRVELSAPAEVHWTSDGWSTTQPVRTRDTGLGLHVADLPTERLAAGATVAFRVAPADNDLETYQVDVVDELG